MPDIFLLLGGMSFYTGHLTGASGSEIIADAPLGMNILGIAGAGSIFS